MFGIQIFTVHVLHELLNFELSTKYDVIGKQLTDIFVRRLERCFSIMTGVNLFNFFALKNKITRREKML